MTDFKAKMHQIRFWLAPPDPLAGFGGLLLRRGKGKGGREGREEGREEREGEGRRGKGKGRKGP